MIRRVSLIMTVLLPITSFSDNFQSSTQEFERYQQSTEAEFTASKNEFDIYQAKLLSAFDQYLAEAARVWGSKNQIKPGAYNWISYQGDMRHRSIVDFRQGTINVEIAVDKPDASKPEKIDRELQNTIVNTLRQGADTRSMLELAKHPVAVPSGPPVLVGQIADSSGYQIDDAEYEKLARQMTQNVRRTQVTGSDGKKRQVYSVTLNMVPDHIRKRAARFTGDVERFAEREKMPAALVLAVMENESYFNPMARSPAPAFGLMQLVPISGAREAYRYVYGKDRIVKDTYLYNPTNNIELGTAYLNRLYYAQLSEIEDPTSRTWCSIAAYNTGAGNVFRTFAGRYSSSRFGSYARWKQAALREINRRSPEQVFSFLKNHLPYTATRHYITKIRNSMKQYQ